MKIPFVDLKAQHASLKGEIDAAVSTVMSKTAFISGRYAAVFEGSFAEYIGTEHCVAVANGTVAATE
jgi:dTDP-4-amino-4,6-dideoxygalactose transaminase